MKRVIAAAAVLLALSTSDAVLALAQRTFVASSGSDTWPCTRPQPCRSFAMAISNTTDRGEVIVLDSAGYGPFTVAQSVSVVAPAGIYGGVTVTSGSGVTVNGGGITVTLRGLSINSPGGAASGVVFQQGSALTIEDCEIGGGSFGVDVVAIDARLAIKNSVLRNSDHGVYARPSSGYLRVTIADSVIAHVLGNGVTAESTSGSTVQISVTRSILTSTAFPVVAAAYGVGSASILSDGNTITYATNVFTLRAPGATIFTAGNNTVGYYQALYDGGTLTSCCTI